MASVELTWDNTSWRVASVWLIMCALCLAFLLACLAHLCLHLSANSCISWMSSYSSWTLAWLAFHRSLREGDTLTLLSWYWQDDSLTLLLSGCWQGDCLILPWSGCTLPEATQELVEGLTWRWDWKNGVPPPNYPRGTLGDGGMSSNPLPPTHVVTVPQIHWREVASTNAACPKGNWAEATPPEKVPTSR